MKSLMYLSSILISFFLLSVFGVVSGAFIGSFLGASAAVAIAVTGGVVGICGWFKLVGFVVEMENSDLLRRKTDSSVQLSAPVETGLFLSARDARRGNHLMAGGIITFLSSLIAFSTFSLLIGGIGLGAMIAGFIISLAAYEFPSEEGVLRKVKLLLDKARR
ncbi:MAG: hypothetical protein M3209_07235 [Acidobacteriota bacterium]|nr:hypothetical protein [Acidobacteriota bacterium]